MLKSAEKKRKQKEYAMKYEKKRAFEAETQKRMTFKQKEALYEIESQLVCLVDSSKYCDWTYGCYTLVARGRFLGLEEKYKELAHKFSASCVEKSSQEETDE